MPSRAAAVKFFPGAPIGGAARRENRPGARGRRSATMVAREDAGKLPSEPEPAHKSC